MEKQSYKILCYYLKKLEIFFNKTTLKQLITSHPDGDSLYAMVDVLNEIGIKNISLKSDIKGLLYWRTILTVFSGLTCIFRRSSVYDMFLSEVIC
jgi:hypothetical protein